jgi:hypothetical protein
VASLESMLDLPILAVIPPPLHGFPELPRAGAATVSAGDLNAEPERVCFPYIPPDSRQSAFDPSRMLNEASPIPDSRRSSMAAAEGSADQSSKRMADVCGRPRARRMALPSISPSPSRLRHSDAAA